MFLLVFVAIGLGFILIFFITATSPQRREEPFPETGQKTSGNKWTKKEFEKHCIAIVQGLGLKISNITQEKGAVMEIYAVNPAPLIGGLCIIHSLYLPEKGIAQPEDILTLSSIVKYEGATKGIFITTGIFPKTIDEFISESPIECIDGEKFEELIKVYSG